MEQSRSINLDVQKQRILQFIKAQGPNIPIPISNHLQIDSLLTSAFLAELISEKLIKMSRLKVGNSPVYYLLGQERQLENFSQFLGDKEKEAFNLLKQEGVLLDSSQKPPIRVALRSLGDFAFPFQFKGTLFWRYLVLNEKQAVELVKKRSSRGALIIPKPHVEKVKKQVISKEQIIPKEQIISSQKPVRPRDKGKSDFVNNVEGFLFNNNLLVSGEIEFKKKEYNARINVNSQLGGIEFLCMAKDKKFITENDIKLALQESNSKKMPVLFISPGTLNKKAAQKLKEMNNLIFFKQLE